MKPPQIIHEDLDPKNFDSYEEYKEVTSEFYEIFEKVEEVFAKAKTDEELEHGLHKLGFISHNDTEWI